MLTAAGQNNGDGSFNWKDAVADSAVMAGYTFFITLVGITVSDLGTLAQACLPGAIAAGGQFFLVLSTKRGLRKEVKE
jgi:hypothetical protein